MTKAKSLRKRKTTSSITPGKGNIFEFYIPKIPNSNPRPKTIINKNDPTKWTYDKSKPADFLNKSFMKTTSVNFGSSPKKTFSARYPALSLPQIIHAALECGYGRIGMWSSHLLLDHKESCELASYLLKRLLMVASCIKIDKDDAYFTQEFYSKIEPSEKVAISFIAGGIGSFIAAHHWFDAVGEKINVMLHSSIYIKGLSPSINTNTLTSQKSPDYLIESSSGEWHVFESKGGTDAGRYKRILEGLLQLDTITHLAWASPTASSSPKPVTTSVCTHTCINAGTKLKVLAYDPPSEHAEEGQTIVLDEAVCKLLKIIESLDQFHVIDSAVVDEDGLQWKSVPQIKDLKVALPSQYFDLEARLRTKLGLYFLTIESIDTYKNKNTWSAKSNINLIERKTASHRFKNIENNITKEFIIFINQLSETEEPKDFISLCRQHFNLDEMLDEFKAVLEKVIIQSGISNETSYKNKKSDIITSSGMIIRDINDAE